MEYDEGMGFLQAIERHRKWIVISVFVLFLGAGFISYGDYGVSADEPAMRKFGHDTYSYLFEGGDAPVAVDWTFHGPAYQLLPAAIERAMGPQKEQAPWAMRHLVSFLLFYLSIVCFYRLAIRYSGNWMIALLGTLMLILSPRLFAHSFYNPKDIPAFAFFVFSFASLFWWLERPTKQKLVVHALACGILISLRSFGLLVPLIGFAYLLADAFIQRGDKALFAKVGAYALSVTLATYLVWPVLWKNPVGGLFHAILDNTSRLGDKLYFGEFMSSTPWHYLPVWMLITIPLVYTLFFLAGFFILVRALAKHPLRFANEERMRTAVLAWFAVPFLALVVLRIGIFDEWRHALFLYPAFILIAMDGIDWLFDITPRYWKYSHLALTLLFAYGLISSGAWMIRNHPFEYAYFSIPSGFINGKFSLDYWSLSYLQALEYIVKNDNRKEINVYPAARVGLLSADMLPVKDWKRIFFTDAEFADYILDNFRGNAYKESMTNNKQIHSFAIDGISIMKIYQGPAPVGIYPVYFSGVKVQTQ